MKQKQIKTKTLIIKQQIPNDNPGACLVVNPETGESECIFVSKTECQKLHGTFIGGPCGGL